MTDPNTFPPRSPYMQNLIARAQLAPPETDAEAERRYREAARARRRDRIQLAILGLIVVIIAVAIATGAFQSFLTFVAPAADASSGGLTASGYRCC